MIARAASPFSRGAVLGLVVVGFLAFAAMLYFLSVGDTGGDENNGGAHAASNGLTGYSALTQLLEADGNRVVVSRDEANLDSPGLLVLTPPENTDADEISSILSRRAYIGPTLVIVPKWFATGFPRNLDPETADKIKPGWVQLGSGRVARWLEQLDDPYALEAEVDLNKSGPARWISGQVSGSLPSPSAAGAQPESGKRTIVSDGKTRALALTFPNVGYDGDTVDTQMVTFVVEPDLLNNFGMNERSRAALAMRLIERARFGDKSRITFDLTANGLGAQVNLLTLAFRPPFLAATLCLILALLIVGWRAFKRFGPAVADDPATAFGKSRLVTNGAGLIVRARRMGLLAEPYADLSARRLARSLGLAKPDPEAIDAALARRLPEEEPFSHRAARLRDATSSSEILRAAQALKELEGKLSQ